MKLKTYQAYTMAEALAAVKRDLGQSAVILHTRTFKRGGFLGFGRKTVVEVTATVDEQARKQAKSDAPPSAPAAHSVSPAALGAHRAYAANQHSNRAASDSPATSHAPVDEPQPVTDDDRRRTQQLAQMLAEQYERREQAARDAAAEPAEERPPSTSVEEEAPLAGGSSSSATPSADTTIERERGIPAEPPMRSDAARRFILTPESRGHDDEADEKPIPGRAGASGNGHRLSCGDDSTGDRARDHTGASPSSAREPVELFAEDMLGNHGRSNDSRAMQEELAAIRDMVGQVLQRQTTRGSGSGGTAQPTMPRQLFEMYLKLIGQDISEELADRIINDVRDDLTSDELNDEDKLREAMLQHLTDYIPTAEQAVSQYSPDDRPLTIALVGPTGVGKTTTLAKLAASFKLRHNRKVGMITSDTYRIAAVDQLRTYANIIGLPLQVALTPREMEQCMHTLSDCDVILIDTAGRGQNDADRLDELKQFISAAHPHEVHLVLSGTASEKVLLREAEAFSEVGVDKIVLTKLDEAVSFGMLVDVIRQLGKELSFFTTGQEVPDHIEVGRPERLAELILGGKVHS